MGTRNLVRTIGVMAIVLLSFEACFGFDDGDFQYWNTTAFSFELNPDWKVTVEEELRFQDEASRLAYHHTDVGFVYSGLANWVDLGFNYRQAFVLDSKDEWITENRPHINVTFKGNLSGLAISNRSRFEFRDVNAGDDTWRYRNKLTIKFPQKFTSLELQPYIADEVFINFNHGGYTTNRLYAGASCKLIGNLKGAIYYLWQSARSDGGRKDINVLGSKLVITF